MASREELEILLRAKDEASKVIEQVAKSTGGLKENLADTAKAGAAFGAGFTVATQVLEKMINLGLQAAQSVAKLAEEAERISNKALITGFATDSVQALGRLAKNAGSSADAVFAAINRMQRAAVDGKAGFTQLGLGVQEFLKLAPEDQLRTVAERIMALPTAAERAAAAMNLFGRSGAELLPVLKELAERGTTEIVGMSEAQIKALKKVDDSFDRLKGAAEDLTNQFIFLMAQVAGATKEKSVFDVWADGLERMARLAKDKDLLAIITGLVTRSIWQAGPQGKAPPIISGGLSAGLGTFGTTEPGGGVMSPSALMFPGSGVNALDVEARAKAVEKLEKAALKADRERERSAKKLADELERLEQRQIDGAMKVEAAQIKSFDALDKAAAAHTNYVIAQDEKVWAAQEKLLKEEEALSAKMAAAEAKALDEQRKHREPLANSFGRLADVFGSTREALVAMGVDGNSALMRITVGLQTAFSAASGFLSAFAKGDTLGMIGSAIGGVVGIASALGIGGNKTIMQVNDLRDAFFAAHGGWLQVQKDLTNLSDQDLVAKIFSAKTVAEFNAAVGEAMNLLDTQARAQEELQAAIEKYGITIEELGPQFAQNELDKQAAQLMKEFELLTAAGVNVDVVISKMGASLVEYVQTSIAAGSTIPEAMRPIVDGLIEQGLLLDENGNAYKSAQEAGITYAQTLTEAMASVVEEIRNLVAALTGIPRHVSTTVTTHHEDTYSQRRGVPADAEQDQTQLARGAIIGRNVLPFIPRAAQGLIAAQPGGSPVVVGEGGQAELVAPVRALAREIGAAAAAAAGGGGAQVIQIVLDGRVIAEAMVKRNRAGGLPIAAESVRKDG